MRSTARQGAAHQLLWTGGQRSVELASPTAPSALFLLLASIVNADGPTVEVFSAERYRLVHVRRVAKSHEPNPLEFTRLFVVEPPRPRHSRTCPCKELSDLVFVNGPRQVAAEELHAAIRLLPGRLVGPLHPPRLGATTLVVSAGAATLGFRKVDAHRPAGDLSACKGDRLGSRLDRVEVDESDALELAVLLEPLDLGNVAALAERRP
mmetsp:Transcript_83932/g.167529  ORF Transcript_83932/g.167529 Transcript_83932/m.167529 type:complete len:208 (+) Transcript_83932:325-948(+)